MIIRNAQIVLEDKVVQGSLRVEGSTITEIVSGDMSPQKNEEVIDAAGKWLLPGVVDLHMHGAGGFDLLDGEVSDIIGIARSLATHGTTTTLPTTLTSSDEDLWLFLKNFKEAQKYSGPDAIAKMPGCHLEGPYFEVAEKGAQDPRYIRPVEREHYMSVLEEAEGTIWRWSLAPELDGAMELIDHLVAEGILVSGGHTIATYDVISEAFDRGMMLLTHFYSSMSSLTRKGGFRILGTIESGYLIDELYVEIIADGMHLPPELLELIFKCKRHDRIIACSDSMRGAGMPEGPTILGSKHNGVVVYIEDGIAKMPDRTCFASSIATGDRIIRTLYQIAGLSMPEVAKLASLQPAKLINLDDEIGSIAVGKRADLLLCDDEITIESVFVDGQRV